MKKLILLLCFTISSCAAFKTVRQQDLDSWVGVPAEALDTHSLFLTLPMIKTVTKSGIEIRVYPDKRNIGGCYKSTIVNTGDYINYTAFNSFQTCTSDLVGCDNIFYIKNDKVIEYKPVGKCFTDERVQPEKRYWNLIK